MKCNIIIFFSVIVLLGCSDKDCKYLQSADAILNEQPDSTFCMLLKIDYDKLSKKNKAYYTLLFVSAKYKQYMLIENDSLINIAVDYYTNNFEKDKLTRALMYKKGVLSNIDYNKLASDCYKDAEVIADTSDYLILGLLNTCLGELYQRTYIGIDEDIIRNKQALYYYRKTEHKLFESYSLSSIGKLYNNRNRDSALLYIDQAIDLAKQNNDKQTLFNNKFLKACLYRHYGVNYHEAKKLLLEVYRNRDSVIVDGALFMELSNLYVKLGQMDSARYIAQQFPKRIESTDTISYDMMLEQIALVRGDYKNAYFHYQVSDRIADSIMRNNQSHELYSTDKQFDNTITNPKAENYRLGNTVHNYIIAIILLVFILATICIFILLQRKRRLEIEKDRVIDQLLITQDMLNRNINTINDLNKIIEQKLELEQSLKAIVADRMQIHRDLMAIKYQFGEKPEFFIRQFDKVMSFNKKSKAESEVVIRMVNQLNNNIIDYIVESNPDAKLNDNDKLLLSLICLEFSTIETKVFLDSPNMEALYMQRSRLGKKLKTFSLEKYIETIKNSIFKG